MLIFRKPFLSQQETHSAYQSSGSFCSVMMPLIPVSLFWGGGLGGFLMMGTKGCPCGMQNISSWFVEWCSQVWAGAVNHLYPPRIPWAALGIAFSKPLKWELIPQSSRSKWEQRINVYEVLGEVGEPSVSLQMSPRCCWLWDTALGLGVLSVPQINPIPNWHHRFLPFLPYFQWSEKAEFREF